MKPHPTQNTNANTIQSLEAIFYINDSYKNNNYMVVAGSAWAKNPKAMRQATVHNRSTIVIVSASLCVVRPSVRLSIHSCQPCLFALI